MVMYNILMRYINPGQRERMIKQAREGGSMNERVMVKDV